MSRRNHVAGWFSVAATVFVFAGAAAADEAGCAALAERVKAGVVAVARGQGFALPAPTSGGGIRVAPALGGPYTCSATAAVASRAFGDALEGLDVRLNWNDDWLRPGDYCLSHRLDQCYPSQNRVLPLAPAPEFAFIVRAWRGVTQALESQMPYGTGGDLSRFTDTSLDSALSSELRAIVGEGRSGSGQEMPAGGRAARR